MNTAENINLLENKIKLLKTAYEQYFLRVIKREPIPLRRDVEKLIAQCGNQQTHNTALKFRLNSITARYHSYKNYWTRVLRAIEDGTYQRDLFKMSLAVPGKMGAASEEIETPRSTKVVDNDEKMKSLYEDYIGARKECHESVDGIPYEKLRAVLLQHAEKTKEQYKCKDVKYKVSIKDGKAKIVIIPVKGRQ
jgi:hypothetical protein